MGLKDVKVIYALAPGGKRVTIPLIKEGSYDVDDIKQRLLKAGVAEADLPYVIFSGDEPTLPIAPDLQTGAVPGLSVTDETAVQPPDIPKPSKAGVPPPLTSDIVIVASVPVTKEWTATTGCSFNMKNTKNGGYVNVQKAPVAYFTPEDYDIIQSGRLELCYGLIWRQIGVNFLAPTATWDTSIKVVHGMSTTNSISVSATVGFSGGGASASLTSTFSHSITITDETTTNYQVNVHGQEGTPLITASLWTLNRVFVQKIDGVALDPSDPFNLIYTDPSKGPVKLISTWGPNYDAISDFPSLTSAPPFATS